MYPDNPKYIFPHCAPHDMLLKRDEWMLECYGGTLFFWGFYIVSFVLHMAELYVTVQSEKGGWLVSPEQASYLCAYQCSAFPKKAWQQIYYTWKERAREDSAHLNTLTYHKSHIKAIEIMEYVHISISQNVDWQGNGPWRQSIISVSLTVPFYWTRPVMIHIFTTDLHILRGID